MAADSSALVEDLFREFASGEKLFDPEALVSDGVRNKSKKKKAEKEKRRSGKHKKRHRRSRSSSGSWEGEEGGRRLRMDKEAERRTEARAPSPPAPLRPSSPVFHRTDISRFVEDARARIAKGFDDRVGEVNYQTEIKATSLSEYLRKKGHEVPDALAEVEKVEEETPEGSGEQGEKGSGEGTEGKEGKEGSEEAKAEAALLHATNVELKSFPLSKNGEDVAKKKPVPVKSSKAFLPRNLKMGKKDDSDGPSPPVRKPKEVEPEEDEGEDLVGKPLILQSRLTSVKPKIAISMSKKREDVEGGSAVKAGTSGGGEDGEIESDHEAGHSSGQSINDPQSDGELKEEEETKPVVSKASSRRPKKEDRKKRRRRSRSSSADTFDSYSRRKSKSSRREKSSRGRKSRSRSRERSRKERERRRRKESRRRRSKTSSSRSRSPSRSKSKKEEKKKESWSWGTGETRRKRKRGPYGYDRDRGLSRSPSRSSSESDSEAKIDKKKLFEIARRNASAMLQVGTLQQIRNLSQGEMAALKAGGKSVDELVEYCKTIQKREKKEKGEEDVSTDSEAVKLEEDELDFTIHHPYALAQKAGIVLNIPNSTPLPVNQMTSAQRVYRENELRTSFPVSSGKHHAVTSSEWTPVEKDEGQKALPAPPEQKAIMAPPPPRVPDPLPLPPPPPPPPSFLPPPGGISGIVTRRGEAQKRLALNPSDPEAMSIVQECDDQMKSWAESKNLPGAFVGTTGVQCLTPDELAPRDKRFQAWVTRDQLRNARTVESKVGLNLLMKMGWSPGEGLGRNGAGTVEPLVVDIKSDRKGLVAAEEAPKPMPLGRTYHTPVPIGGKQPVSALTELCAKRRWGPPSFECQESGGFHNRRYLWKVRVNGVDYQPATPSAQKKAGKAMAATVALQSLGLIPRDPNLPMIIA